MHWQNEGLNPSLGILHLLLPDYSISATQLALLQDPKLSAVLVLAISSRHLCVYHLLPCTRSLQTSIKGQAGNVSGFAGQWSLSQPVHFAIACDSYHGQIHKRVGIAGSQENFIYLNFVCYKIFFLFFPTYLKWFPVREDMTWGFPCGSAGKESPCNVGDLGLTPGLERSPGEGKGYPLQYSGLETSRGHKESDTTERLIYFSNYLKM